MYAVAPRGVAGDPAVRDAVRVAAVDLVRSRARAAPGGESASSVRATAVVRMASGAAHGANSPPPVAGASAGVVDCGWDAAAGCSKVNSGGVLSATGTGAAVSCATAGSPERRGRVVRDRRSRRGARFSGLRSGRGRRSASVSLRPGAGASARGAGFCRLLRAGLRRRLLVSALAAAGRLRRRNGQLEHAGDDADGARAEAAEAEADDRSEGGDPAAARAGADLGGGDDVGAAHPVQPAVDLRLELEPAARRSAAAWSAVGSMRSTASWSLERSTGSKSPGPRWGRGDEDVVGVGAGRRERDGLAAADAEPAERRDERRDRPEHAEPAEARGVELADGRAAGGAVAEVGAELERGRPRRRCPRRARRASARSARRSRRPRAPRRA